MRDSRVGALFAALLFCLSTHAQTFTATPATGPSPLSTTLAWAAPANAVNCQASGSWTGLKPASGSQPVTNLTAKATYILTCDVPGAPVLDTAVFVWTPPTQNIDNSPLTDLAGFIIYSGTKETDISTKVKDIPDPTATRYTITGLSDGTYYFAILAYNAAFQRSALSGALSKTFKSSPMNTQWSFTLDVVPAAPKVPKAPVLSVQ